MLQRPHKRPVVHLTVLRLESGLPMPVALVVAITEEPRDDITDRKAALNHVSKRFGRIQDIQLVRPRIRAAARTLPSGSSGSHSQCRYGTCCQHLVTVEGTYRVTSLGMVMLALALHGLGTVGRLTRPQETPVCLTASKAFEPTGNGVGLLDSTRERLRHGTSRWGDLRGIQAVEWSSTLGPPVGKVGYAVEG